MEGLRILKKNELPKYRQKSKRFVQEKLLEQVDESVLWKQVCEELFERDYTTIEDEIARYKSGKNG